MSYVSATAGYNLKQLETPTAKSRLQYISMIHKRKTPQSGVLRRHSFVELTIARTHNLDTSKLLNKVNKKNQHKKITDCFELHFQFNYTSALGVCRVHSQFIAKPLNKKQ